jgi:putative flippase GtrA
VRTFKEAASSLVRAAISRTGAKKVRYLLAGGWNTLFGYVVGLVLYYGLDGRAHVLAVGIVANILAITMAFLTYKLFVFRTRGNWLTEYFRAYLVYGATSALGIALLWVLVDRLGVAFWIAQGFVILFTVVVSYLSHSRFTFRRNEISG